MRLVRLIPIAGLKPRTFKSWANQIVAYISLIPGDELHVVSDNYGMIQI